MTSEIHFQHPITAIIQARMSSSRLPGKVLRPIAGQPMLNWVVERARRAATLDQIVVATTTDPSDDPLADFCLQQGLPYFRGDLYDVLDRYYQASRCFGASVIVRITADCPLIDPQVVDRTVRAFFGQTEPQDVLLSDKTPDAGTSRAIQEPGSLPPVASPRLDLVANRLPPPWGRTYPIGLDTEVCSFAGLETAWQEASQPHQREHVMPFFYDHADRFKILLVHYPQDFGKFRWTVDTAEDLELLQQIAAAFPGRNDFTWLEVLDLFQRQPELTLVNAGVQHKSFQTVDQRFQKPSQ
jgi:spore coat polysaccharide biosynthesis protein SpsF